MWPLLRTYIYIVNSLWKPRGRVATRYVDCCYRFSDVTTHTSIDAHTLQYLNMSSFSWLFSFTLSSLFFYLRVFFYKFNDDLISIIYVESWKNRENKIQRICFETTFWINWRKLWQEMPWISKRDVYWNLIRRSLNNLEKSIRTTSH